MIEVIKSLIIDFHESSRYTGVPRRLSITLVPGKAAICIGVRRSGKSTYMYQSIEKLINGGIDPANIVYLNFFDDRLHDLRFTGPGVISEAYYSMYPEKKDRQTVYYFFDEIQVIPGWESFIDRLLRTEKCQVFLTGSSAHLLSKDIATQMRGRALSWEIFPFSFGEFLDWKEIPYSGALSTAKRLKVQKAFDEYWEKGGFPEIAGVDRFIRVKIHQEYFQAILFRDLVERYDISHPKAVSDLAHWLVNNISSLYSINSLTGYLKGLGHKVHKTLVSEYLEWFEDAYFLFSVKVYDSSISRSNANPKKIYSIDHGLIRSVSTGILVNSGHMLENLVFTSLSRMHREVYYYKTRNGREVDFVVNDGSLNPSLLQVCESLADPSTRKREIRALTEAMDELGVQYGKIVTRNEEEHIKTGSAKIEVLPCWRFLLR